MQTRQIVWLAALGVLAAQPAPAAEKAGTWRRTTETHIIDPSGALQSLSADIARKMMASTGTVTTTYCAVDNAPLATEYKASPTLTCKMLDPQVDGAVFHTKFVCDGDTHGPGKMTTTYDTAEHYTGVSTYSPDDMSSLKWKSTYEGQWIGPTCATP